MRLNIREIKRVSSTGAKVTVNITEGSILKRVNVSSNECLDLISKCNSYDCKKGAFSILVKGMKLYSQLLTDIECGKCELY